MRLIDADALMREFAEFVRESNNSDFADIPTWNDAVSLLGSAPTADAVEVVRCKDCRFFKGDGLECHSGMFAYEDDYCSNGERREDV